MQKRNATNGVNGFDRFVLYLSACNSGFSRLSADNCPCRRYGFCIRKLPIDKGISIVKFARARPFYSQSEIHESSL